jgi:hypothetical protein
LDESIKVINSQHNAADGRGIKLTQRKWTLQWGRPGAIGIWNGGRIGREWKGRGRDILSPPAQPCRKSTVQSSSPSKQNSLSLPPSSSSFIIGVGFSRPSQIARGKMAKQAGWNGQNIHCLHNHRDADNFLRPLNSRVEDSLYPR